MRLQELLNLLPAQSFLVYLSGVHMAGIYDPYSRITHFINHIIDLCERCLFIPAN